MNIAAGITVIKVGGRAFADPTLTASLATELASQSAVVLVHGGGVEVTEWLARLGIQARFESGIRMTGEAEMAVVDAVLCGLVNKRLVRLLTACGARAVGISGADDRLFVAQPINDAEGNITRTARDVTCEPAIVHKLVSAGYLPVIASPGSDSGGVAVNINADDAALALAKALAAERLVYLSDVAGVLADRLRVDVLDRARGEELVREGTITGGMIPKIETGLTAVEKGVGQVIIGSYEQEGDIQRLFRGERGTRIVKEW